MYRFYLDPVSWGTERPGLDEADSHHCADVLRLQLGTKITVFDGRGTVAEAELTEVHRKHCALRLGEPATTPPLRCAITLAQAVPKGKNMDLILQKAVELGAARIVPLLSARTIVRIDDPSDAVRKKERWRQIALEACKQCGRNAVPEVAPLCSVERFAEEASGLLLLASLQPDTRPLREVLDCLPSKPDIVTVLVGPEGDFTPGEISCLKVAGAFPVTLGPTILRAETAALYCLSVLGHELF